MPFLPPYTHTHTHPHTLTRAHSGGDWALQQQGAITLTGTEGAEISNNLFTRLDGNAIYMGACMRMFV